MDGADIISLTKNRQRMCDSQMLLDVRRYLALIA